MFPYILLLPIWILASLVWPVLESLHALHTKDQANLKVWLFYWLGYAVIGFVFSFPFVETLVQFPFMILSSVFVDLYYEARLAAVVALVNPQIRCLDKVIVYLEKNAEPATAVVMEKFEMVKGLAQQQIEALQKKKA